ncbi:hypothetical protein BGW38_004299 [Lunasporangiospora selenospora]|uniref:C2H2-type domain-containing protein n=1 Tax=Lunasporangiospora selenospora TaxID=979761 RepID=A0A9P6FQ00_9FUNG|nr:hypothetical protein BGW38_004299 [Lunasporangiospora selenospora]
MDHAIASPEAGYFPVGVILKNENRDSDRFGSSFPGAFSDGYQDDGCHHYYQHYQQESSQDQPSPAMYYQSFRHSFHINGGASEGWFLPKGLPDNTNDDTMSTELCNPPNPLPGHAPIRRSQSMELFPTYYGDSVLFMRHHANGSEEAAALDDGTLPLSLGDEGHEMTIGQGQFSSVSTMSGYWNQYHDMPSSPTPSNSSSSFASISSYSPTTTGRSTPLTAASSTTTLSGNGHLFSHCQPLPEGSLDTTGASQRSEPLHYPRSSRVSFSERLAKRASSSGDKKNRQQFVCTIPDCGKSFNRASNLKSHLQTHQKNPSNECLECSKKFLRVHDLRRHMSSHSSIKQFQCPACKGLFARADAVTRHLKNSGGANTCAMMYKELAIDLRAVVKGEVSRSLLGNEKEIDKMFDKLGVEAYRMRIAKYLKPMSMTDGSLEVDWVKPKTECD